MCAPEFAHLCARKRRRAKSLATNIGTLPKNMSTNFQLKRLKLNLDNVEKPENRVHKLTDSNVSRIIDQLGFTGFKTTCAARSALSLIKLCQRQSLTDDPRTRRVGVVNCQVFGSCALRARAHDIMTTPPRPGPLFMIKGQTWTPSERTVRVPARRVYGQDIGVVQDLIIQLFVRNLTHLTAHNLTRDAGPKPHIVWFTHRGVFSALPRKPRAGPALHRRLTKRTRGSLSELN